MIMETFWKLFTKSVIVTALLALVLVIILGVLLIQGKPVPDQMWTITFAVVGFWFGTKANGRTETTPTSASTEKPSKAAG
jgi:hypothetical protein